jgi:hypothetical protein
MAQLAVPGLVVAGGGAVILCVAAATSAQQETKLSIGTCRSERTAASFGIGCGRITPCLERTRKGTVL